MDTDKHIDKDTQAIYSLGALEPRAARQVQMHVETCVECRNSLNSYNAVAEGLLHVAPQIQPPAGLRARLVVAITDDPAHSQKTFWEKLKSIPLAPIAVGLSAVLLVFNIGLWVQMQEIQQTEQQLLMQISEDRIAQGLYAYPDVHRVLIEGEGVYGSAIYEEYLQFAVLYIWGLDPLPEDQVYQAWLIEPDGKRVSGGLFVVQEGDQFIQAVVQAPEMIKSFMAIGVTVEPGGGSDSPTGQKVLGVDL